MTILGAIKIADAIKKDNRYELYNRSKGYLKYHKRETCRNYNLTWIELARGYYWQFSSQDKIELCPERIYNSPQQQGLHTDKMGLLFSVITTSMIIYWTEIFSWHYLEDLHSYTEYEYLLSVSGDFFTLKSYESLLFLPKSKSDQFYSILSLVVATVIIFSFVNLSTKYGFDNLLILN